MNIHKQNITTLRLAAALAGLLVSGIFADVSPAAIDFHQAGAAGGGQQFVYAPSTPVSGTMMASVPRFNGGLGTLLQADFEFAGSITGTWLPPRNPAGGSALQFFWA